MKMQNHRIKTNYHAKWSNTVKAWLVDDSAENRKIFNIDYSENITSKSKIPTHEIQANLTKFNNWLKSKRYSPNTAKTYTEALRIFLVYFENKGLAEITNEDILLKILNEM